MEVKTDIIEVSSKNRIDIINITNKISEKLELLNANMGLLNIFVKHTTCGIVINEAESGLLSDIKNKLSEIIPYGAGYNHDRIDSNADAHLKSSLTSSSITIPVINGRLSLGTWQSILFLEFDGPRNRKINITFIGE